MPFVDQDTRKDLCRREPSNGAELSYVLTQIVANYIRYRPDMRYDDLAAIRAAIEGCLDYFLRKHLWPYEDNKRVMNGDIK